MQRLQTLLKKAYIAFQKSVYAGTAAAGCFLVYHGYLLSQLKQILPDNEQAEIEITVGEEKSKLSFEDYCRLNPISTCWDNSEATDFLYQDNEHIAVMEPEQVNPELLEEALSDHPAKLRKLAEVIERTVNSETAKHNQQLFAEMERLNQSILDRLYEEELPENIIDEEPDNEFTHINNKKIKDIKFLPYKKPYYFGPQPVIAIVIDDMGISQKRTRDISSLAAPLTASFLTYGSNLAAQVKNSQDSGQEIMIHVPMEAQKNVDTAPDVLTTRMSVEEIQERLKIMLEKFENVRGINNHMGSKLTEDEKRMEAVMQVLKKEGLFFLDSKTSPKSRAKEAAVNQNVAYAHRHVFLDNNNNKKYILNQLAQTERLARKNGYAIAIGHPKSQTFAALREWLPQLPEKNLKLVHLSDIVTVLNPQLMKTAEN